MKRYPSSYNSYTSLFLNSSAFRLYSWHRAHRDLRIWAGKRREEEEKKSDTLTVLSISPLVHLKNEKGDCISTNDTVHPGGHSNALHVLTLCWLFKRNLHVEGSLWNGPYYYLWSSERPVNYSNAWMERGACEEGFREGGSSTKRRREQWRRKPIVACVACVHISTNTGEEWLIVDSAAAIDLDFNGITILPRTHKNNYNIQCMCEKVYLGIIVSNRQKNQHFSVRAASSCPSTVVTSCTEQVCKNCL